ncbi:Porin [Granulibacter bethesdensis]|nr:Porin [Granulibacter bethesdensis]
MARRSKTSSRRNVFGLLMMRPYVAHFLNWRSAVLSATIWCGFSTPSHAQSILGFGDLSDSFSLIPPPTFAAPEANQQMPLAVAPPLGENESYDGPLWDRDYLIGDPFHMRTYLNEKGVNISMMEQSEVLGNLTGGLHTGAVYDGLTSIALTTNLEKLAGIPGLQFNVSAFHFHGRSITLDNLSDLNTASGLEADRGFRLNELWLDQSLWDGLFSLRLGQQSVDNEFMISYYSMLFINGGFGWPTLPSIDLPNGGNAFPLPTPGIRFRFQPRPEYTLLIGAYNGNPGSYVTNPSGTAFPINEGLFAIVEFQYDLHHGGKDGLPGFYHLGSYYNSASFNNAASTVGLSPVLNRHAILTYRNDWAVYFSADQMLYREKDTEDQGLGTFIEIISAPSDRNLVSFNVNAGLTYKGLIPKRNLDTIGISVAYSRISDGKENGFIQPQNGVVQKGSETVFELTYQASITHWWLLQPDLQYVFNPSAGLALPTNPSTRIGNELIMGLRTTITF